MNVQPPDLRPPPAAGVERCPRCSSELHPDQDWCLECGAPARTRLAPTPNWRLPTVALAAVIAVAGAALAFAFVRLTGDDGPTPASTAPAVLDTTPPTPTAPPVTSTLATPTATTTAPVAPSAPPATVPGQTGPTPTTITPRARTGSRVATAPRTRTGR